MRREREREIGFTNQPTALELYRPEIHLLQPLVPCRR
jgi:hypothetical protein